VSAAAAVVQLDEKRARALTRELQKTLDLAVELVRELHEREGWRALGHESWPAFCRAELPQLAVIVRGMPKAERRAKVSELRASGMSLRDVAEVTGLAPNTVRSDSAGVQLVAVKSRDGAMRPATATTPATPAKRRPKTDRTVELLRAAGPDGLTVLQVARELRCPQHKAAATLTRLEDSQRITYRRPERRGRFGTYVAGRIVP
jgi:DNA-binding CsgD family transcriptional regulator